MNIEPGVYITDDRVWIISGDRQCVFSVKNGGWVAYNSVTKKILTDVGAKKLLTGNQLRDALFKLAKMEDT